MPNGSFAARTTRPEQPAGFHVEVDQVRLDAVPVPTYMTRWELRQDGQSVGVVFKRVEGPFQATLDDGRRVHGGSAVEAVERLAGLMGGAA